MKPFGYRHTSYKPPGRDSFRALANVRLFLTNAQSLDNVTPAMLAKRYNLTLKTAERELQRCVRS